jgi:hypothetical protein
MARNLKHPRDDVVGLPTRTGRKRRFSVAGSHQEATTILHPHCPRYTRGERWAENFDTTISKIEAQPLAETPAVYIENNTNISFVSNIGLAGTEHDRNNLSHDTSCSGIIQEEDGGRPQHNTEHINEDMVCFGMASPLNIRHHAMLIDNRYKNYVAAIIAA